MSPNRSKEVRKKDIKKQKYVRKIEIQHVKYNKKKNMIKAKRF